MTKSYDVCVVGGGVVGLWVARRLADAGSDAVLVEAQTCAGGASGGILGALMAHAPNNWNEKKQFQFDALVELPGLTKRLEDESGVATGYRRCGRIMPIRRRSFLAEARRRAAAGAGNWQTDDETFAFEVIEGPGGGDWLAGDVAALGIVRDTLAARVDPVRYTAALKASLVGRVEICEAWPFASFDAQSRRVRCAGGEADLVADQIVLAAGYQTFPMLAALTGSTVGGGVKGQAALFRCPEAADQPLINDDGVYIVPHEDGLCAVGSTTERHWDDAATPDPDCNDFIDRAKALCPPLRAGELLRRWAGVRPRCTRTDPVIGRLHSESPVLVATGGYKITFGIAHRMAKCIAEDITRSERRTPLPPTFQPGHHLENR